MVERPPVADDPCISIRVVIADDVEGIRQLWQLVLEEDPEIEVVALARDGREALDAARDAHPDVLVLDLSMPEMSGVEVLEALGTDLPDVAVVVASGFSRSRAARLVLERGAVAYFEKGSPPDGLRDTVVRAATARL